MKTLRSRDSKPRSVCCIDCRLRSSRPAPSSSTSDSATSATRSAERVQRACAAPSGDRCLSSDASGTRDTCSAGPSPKSAVVAQTTSAAKASAGRSNCTASSRGRFAGASAFSASMPHTASTSPSTPPAAASTRLSVSRYDSSRALSRAERRAHGHLVPPRGAADEQQVRDVGARDEQHHRDRAEDHEEREPHVADGAIVQRLHHHGDVGVVGRIFALQSRRQRGHLLLRGLGRCAVGEMPDAVEVHAAASALCVVGPNRRPQPCAVREVETARSDADNRPRRAVDLDGLRQDVRTPAQPLLPVAVADHHRARTARTIFVGREPPADDRRQSENVEEVRRHVAGAHHVGFVLRADDGAAGAEERHRLDRLRGALEIEEVQVRDRSADGLRRRAPGGRSEVHEAIGLARTAAALSSTP